MRALGTVAGGHCCTVDEGITVAGGTIVDEGITVAGGTVVDESITVAGGHCCR